MKSCLKYFVILLCLKFIASRRSSPYRPVRPRPRAVPSNPARLASVTEAALHPLVVQEGSRSFRCDYEYNSAAKGWFKHIVVPATWTDARLRCNLEGAVLASPITRQIKAAMTDIVNTTQSEEEHEIFTGIHATFSQGDYYSVEGIPLSKTRQTWAPNEPDNKDNKESYLTLNSNGDLADLSCEETRPYICYRSVDSPGRVNEFGTTDSQYRFDMRTKSCYKFHTVPRNFSRAFFTCSAEGGHLAIINSETEATVLTELFNQYPVGRMVGNFMKDVAFIGIHNWGELWDFRTIHGETLEEAGYNKYSRGEPNNLAPGQNCGAIWRRTALIDDLWCDRPIPLICEKNPDYPDTCRAIMEDEE